MPSLGADNNLNILINTQADTAGVTKTEESINKLGEQTEKTRGSIENFTKAFIFGNVIYSLTADAALKIKEGFSDAFKASEEWQSQQAALNAALQSTKDVSGVTAEQAKRYAEELSKTTPISREVALAGENMILTFTNIHSNIFPQTTQAVADMATAMNHGLTPSAENLNKTAILVGKALNDPEKGLAALHRVGVAFTEQQKEQIKTMVASGNTLGAQTVILGELSKEFGGRAAASAETFRGKIEILHNKVNDLAGDGIIKLNQRLNDLAKWWDVHQAAIKKVVDQIIDFLEPSFKALWTTIETKVLPVLTRLWKEVIEPLLPIIGGAFVLAVKLVVEAFNALLQIITPVINWMLDHKQVVLDFAATFVILALALKFDDIKASFIGNMEQIMGKIGAVKGSVIDLFTKISGGTAMGGIAVAGALADIGLVAQAVQSVLGAINAMNNAANAASAAGASEDAAIRNIENNTKLTATQKGNLIRNLYGHNAQGTENWQGGLTWVGEEGPELVNLPKGAQVHSAPESKKIAGGTTIHQTNNIYSQMDITLANRELGWQLSKV